MARFVSEEGVGCEEGGVSPTVTIQEWQKKDGERLNLSQIAKDTDPKAICSREGCHIESCTGNIYIQEKNWDPRHFIITSMVMHATKLY